MGDFKCFDARILIGLSDDMEARNTPRYPPSAEIANNCNGVPNCDTVRKPLQTLRETTSDNTTYVTLCHVLRHSVTVHAARKPGANPLRGWMFGVMHVAVYVVRRTCLSVICLPVRSC